MHVWSSLKSREYSSVNFALQIMFDLVTLFILGASNTVEDQGSSCSSQSLVGGCGNNISEGERRRYGSSSNQSRWMGHINQKVCSNLVANLTELTIVDQSAIS